MYLPLVSTTDLLGGFLNFFSPPANGNRDKATANDFLTFTIPSRVFKRRVQVQCKLPETYVFSKLPYFARLYTPTKLRVFTKSV